MDATSPARLSRFRSRVNLTVRCVGVLLAAAVLTACGAGSANEKRPPVSDTSARIDFRTMPTRADLGMGSKGYVTYPSGTAAPAVPTTLVFPTGTVRRNFFQINAGVNFAFAPDDNPRHQPTDLEFFLKAKDLDQAKTFLREDATALGLSEAEIDDVLGQGTSVEQGYVKDWLSTEVEVRDAGNGDGKLNLIYTVAIGAYHNEAVDKILRDGHFTLDLTHRPSAAELGFQRYYSDADITPEPHKQLSVTLRTPSGSVSLPNDGMSSEGRAGQPTITVLTGLTTLGQAPALLRSAAPALGFDRDATLAWVADAGRALRTRTFPCAATTDYTCALRLQTVDDTGAEDSFNYRLTLTYR